MKANVPAKWLCHTVVTGSHYCSYEPVLHCVVIGSIMVRDSQSVIPRPGNGTLLHYAGEYMKSLALDF